MGGRSFAGYAYRDSLGVGFYGELFAATGTGGRDARVLHIARRLAGRSGYPEALARFGSDLAGLEHPSLIPTLTVGRGLDRTVVVVTGGAMGAVSVELISGVQRGQRVPVPVALAIAVSACAGVAAAHARGIVHGALHPRSLLIDAAGSVLVDHFAPARALASLAATSDDADLLDGFRGYLAPELALAEEPTAASDVYSLGAILYFLFGGDVTGEAQPARIAATTTVRRTVARALDTDATRRFPSALELLAELQRAVEVDRLELAVPVDLALYSDDAREAAGLPVGVPAEPAGAASGGLDALLDELDDGADDAAPEQPSDEEPTAIAPPERRAGSAVPEVDDVLASLDGELSDRVDIGTLADDLAAAGGDGELSDRVDIGTLADDLAVAGGDDDLAIADGEMTMPSAVARLRDDPDTAVAPMVSEETGDHSQLTQVDDLAMGPDRDPISELIELERGTEAVAESEPAIDSGPRVIRLDSGDDEDNTPLPPPQVHESGSFTRSGREIVRGKADKSVEQRAADAISSLEDEPDAPPATTPRPIRRGPSALTGLTDHVLPRKKGIPSWAYVIFTLAALGVMFMLVWTRTDVFHPERAARKRAEREAEARAKEAKLLAEQKKGGEIIVEANEEGAAVWLRLGRTPVDSMPLPVYHVHQMRLELPGYGHDDLVVTAAAWTGDRATMTATLKPVSKPDQPPAWPPPVPDAATKGFPNVQELGVVHVTSTPPQAEVWLLVGYTNSVDLRDFEAGVRYEFKLLKDGFQPAFDTIEPDDWKLEGGTDPNALKTQIVRTVKLEPIAHKRGK